MRRVAPFRGSRVLSLLVSSNLDIHKRWRENGAHAVEIDRSSERWAVF